MARTPSHPRALGALLLLILTLLTGCGLGTHTPADEPAVEVLVVDQEGTAVLEQMDTQDEEAPAEPDAPAAPTTQEDAAPEPAPEPAASPDAGSSALEALWTLPVIAHDVAPYDRDDFGGRWVDFDGTGCTSRQDVLRRDATEVVGAGCQPDQLVIQDRYTGSAFVALSAGEVEIDHVVAVYDAWLTGAQDWDDHTRVAFYQDKLNLIATEGAVNQAKSSSNAAQWLPPYEGAHCDFAARVVSVKAKWGLGVTDAEQDALAGVLRGCPDQGLLVGNEETPVFDATPYLTGGYQDTPVNPAPTQNSSNNADEPYYENCAAVRAAGAAPIYAGEPGFRKNFDRDGDGIGCE